MSLVFISATGRTLAGFLDEQAGLADRTGATAMLDAVYACVTGGKRLRPVFRYWGYVVTAGWPIDPGPLLRAATSPDLLHTSLLVRGDLLNGPDIQHGAPLAHRCFKTLLPDPQVAHFGEAATILLDGVPSSWNAETSENAGLSPEVVRHATSVFATMRNEVLLSQYLDVTVAFRTTNRPTPRVQVDTAGKVLEFKSVHYSVRRPAELDTTLGETPSGLLAAPGTYGSLLGRAFQLCDDTLGVLGGPEVTGRPAGDDIRGDKRMVLALTVPENGDARQHDILDSLLSTPGLTEENLVTAREITEATGARNSCEELTTRSTTDALTVLGEVDMDAKRHSALITLTGLTTGRDR